MLTFLLSIFNFFCFLFSFSFCSKKMFSGHLIFAWKDVYLRILQKSAISWLTVDHYYWTDICGPSAFDQWPLTMDHQNMDSQSPLCHIVNEKRAITVYRLTADEGRYRQSSFWGPRKLVRPFLTMKDMYFNIERCLIAHFQKFVNSKAPCWEKLEIWYQWTSFNEGLILWF